MNKDRLFKILHRFILSCVFLVFNWLLVNKLLVDISFIKYCVLEVVILLSMKLYLFTAYKAGL